MSGWHDVLDVQLDLMRFWRTDQAHRLGTAFGKAMRATDEEHYGYEIGNDELTDNIAPIQFGGLAMADPFYIDEEMMDVVEAATEGFQPEAFEPTDMLSPHMFIVLPRPMFMLDRHARLISYRAILLNRTLFQVKDPSGEGEENAGVILSLYSHLYDEDEGLNQPIGEERELLVSTQGTPYVLMHVTPWEFGGAYPGAEPGVADWWQPIQALLRLSLQTISDRYETKPPRASGRRWKRELHTDKYITVIRLRRPRSKREGEEREVEWSHRWIVSGHWRNQFFPSLGVHRQIWVGAYVKGPEDMPLLVRRTRAFELVR